jgi:hypothetical protein
MRLTLLIPFGIEGASSTEALAGAWTCAERHAGDIATIKIVAVNADRPALRMVIIELCSFL